MAFLKGVLSSAQVDVNSLRPRRTQAAEFWRIATYPGDAKRAEEMFEDVRTHDPDRVLFPEYMMNLLGYDRIQRGYPVEGIMNSEAYPSSANTWESLSDAYIANKNFEQALSAEEKCLQILPSDPAPNKEFKVALRKHAEEKIARLKSDPR